MSLLSSFGSVRESPFHGEAVYDLLAGMINNTYLCEKLNTTIMEPVIKNKFILKDLVVLWIALTALCCAAINLHIKLNMLEKKEEQE